MLDLKAELLLITFILRCAKCAVTCFVKIDELSLFDFADSKIAAGRFGLSVQV